MYRILIADDEYWVGRWLKEVLEKSPFDVETAGVCQDGEEALRVLMEDPVDILITDINMPVISGLELLRRARTSGQKLPKAIVISGYDEFEYARQAIELDVLAYLIKPLERHTVFDAVKKAVDTLDQEQEQSLSARTGYHASVENLLREYFRHPNERFCIRLRQIVEQKIPSGAQFLFGMIQNTRLGAPLVPREELKEKLEQACRSRHVFLFCRDAHTWCFLLAGIERVAGFYVEEPVLLQILKGYCWGISGFHREFEELSQAEAEAREALVRKLEAGGYADAAPDNDSQEDLTGGLLTAIETGDKEGVRRRSEQAAEHFVRLSYDVNSCLNFYFVLTGEVIKLLTDLYQREKDDTLLELIDEGYEFSVQIRGFYSIRPVCDAFCEYGIRVIDSLREVGPMSVSDIVQKVQRTIREQYASDLNLGSIADEYSINPSYFSKKFKDETGVNFVDYLAGVRIDQAKALLKNTDLSVSVISARVGFRDPKYFSRVFAAVTGRKPSEYRVGDRGEENA